VASRATLEWVTCWRDSTRSRYPLNARGGVLNHPRLPSKRDELSGKKTIQERLPCKCCMCTDALESVFFIGGWKHEPVAINLLSFW
jgi:hypothetical protein